MADIRVVNRAKWLLMEKLNLSEKDAHYYIEKNRQWI
ncbi:MAG: ANTAR domain-containing protein [Clostridiales bacterium]|nr:MAG: ANTAR domain-containing protein [Clostridiales bacterium]